MANVYNIALKGPHNQQITEPETKEDIIDAVASLLFHVHHEGGCMIIKEEFITWTLELLKHLKLETLPIEYDDDDIDGKSCIISLRYRS